MKTLDPKVIVAFSIKNFLSTAYIIPIWFIGVFILEKVWTNNLDFISKELVILLLDGAGIIFFALLLLGCYYWSWLTFTNFTYELQTDGLHIRSGIVIQKHRVIPYSDIERVEILVNPIVSRFLQLYTVQINTRDIINTEGILRKKQMQRIPGLDSEAAKSLRVELLKGSHIQLVKKTFFDPVSGHYR